MEKHPIMMYITVSLPVARRHLHGVPLERGILVFIALEESLGFFVFLSGYLHKTNEKLSTVSFQERTVYVFF